jgi:putative ABC transport system permease protein
MNKELDEEVRTYLAMAAEEKMKTGMSRKDAVREARLELGNLEVTKEIVRAARWESFVETWWQDLRYGLRMLRRSPGFTAVVVLTLALGIGAATSIFSVVKVVILSPLPFRQPENLVHIWEGHEHYHRGDQAYFSSARPGSLYDWREQSNSFESITAYRWRPRLLTDNKPAELVVAQDVYDQFFETLATPPQLGRTLQVNDYEPSAPHVVVISNAIWIKRFGGDPGVIGRRISLDRESYEIVGVMPPGFYPAPDYPELWTPHWADQAEKDNRNIWGVFALARLEPGVTWEQAQQELDVISARVLQDHPTLDSVGGVVVPMDAQLIGSSWKLLLLLAGGVTLLLLIACVNVANLVLARAVDREKEFAVRTALGAGRGRLVLQLLAEGLVFAVAAGIVGIGVAFAGTRGLLTILPKAAVLPRLTSVKVDLAALAFVCVLTLVSSLVFGFVPLLRASRSGPHDALKVEGRGSSAGTSKRRLGQIFIVSEFVFSLVLLILGVLLVESFLKLRRADPGFDAKNLMAFRIPVPEVSYGKFLWGARDTRREKLYEQLERLLRDIPGVESVGFAANLPLKQAFNPSPVLVTGREPPTGLVNGKEPPLEAQTGTQMVNPDHFRALRVKLVSGHFFEERDNFDAPEVAIVNEAFVRRFFPNEDPVGKEVTVWFAKTKIIGVTSDFKMNALDQQTLPEIFWCLRQVQSPNAWIMLRAKADPSMVAPIVQQKIQAFDADLPVQEMQSMTGVVADSLWLKRVSATLIGLVAMLAILLAGAGIYGVMSYSVSQRRKEVGIRIAFGADRRDVLGLIMGETCRLAVLGSVLGCAAAFIAGRLATQTVYLSPWLASSVSHESLSPAAFLVSSLFLFCLAIAASYAPARRALRADPMVALQHE